MEQISWATISKQGNSLLSPAYKSNGHVFTSGCLGNDSNGNLPEDVTEQTENAILNLKDVLEASGSSLDQVLKVLLFIGDKSYGKVVNSVYEKYFKNQPGRSCVIVGFPNPKVKVELECIAQYQVIKPKL